ncbi:unnamed protein product [Polarella glacialis]|uniref:Uncharacterized protein n=1 Tax=Polarella glacialis TaxID=89957 RepID=A0A813D6N8_POLGL|nr:unnamed protein product [Polarella glacialis]CAE8679216.1 unnamed protein product [Polarella glacialis]
MALREGPFFTDPIRPFLQRNDTMSLDIVRPKDIPRGKVMYCKDEDSSLKTEDIDRAQPMYEHLKYLNKPDLSVGCTDPQHAGGKARSYYAPMDRRPRDLSLTTADIELAQPRGCRHKGDRHTDPVCPNYQLPSSFKREMTPPRFNGRHNMDNSDIEKSCSRVLHPERNYLRDPMECRDIEYTVTNYRDKVSAQSMRPRLDRSLNVKDISEPKRMRPRDTNPLDPVYKVPTNAVTSLHAKYNEEYGLGIEVPRVEAQQHGFVDGSRPRKLTRDNGEPQLSLLREDIAGTVPQRWVGAVPSNIYDPPEVRPMMSFHDPHDIPGAQVGTLKKGIVSGRSCNPLNPYYPMLDGNARPQPVPSFEAQRHPLLRSQGMGASSSMPNLRANGGRGQTPQMLPAADYQTMQREALAAALPQSASASQLGSQRHSRAQTPCGSQQPEQVQYQQYQQNQMPQYQYPGQQQQGQYPPGQTLRFAASDAGSGMLSRRSNASSHGCLPGLPGYQQQQQQHPGYQQQQPGYQQQQPGYQQQYG